MEKMNGTVESLLNRLALLEQRCSRLGAWSVLLSLVLISGCLLSALRPASDVIEARCFVLKSPDGKVWGRLGGEDPENQRGLILYTDEGDAGVILSVFDGTRGNGKGSVLHLEAGSHEPRVFSAFATEGGVGSIIADERLTIHSLVSSGSSSIEFKKVDEKELVKREEFDESQGYSIMHLGVSSDAPSIEGRSRKGDLIFRQPPP